MNIINAIKDKTIWFAGSATDTDVTSFEKMELSISGMRGESGYVAKHEKNLVTIEFYIVRYRNGVQERDVEKRTSIPYSDFLDQLCSCHVGRWNGFHGKHPRGVLDGEQFSVEIDTGEQVIKASGSANFPDGFRDFRRWLDSSLQKS